MSLLRIPDEALNINAEVGTHVCLLKRPHHPHRWIATSEGGGHMILAAFADPRRDRDWHCPGVPEPVVRVGSSEHGLDTIGTATLLDGRGDVERIIAKLREPDPESVRVKIRARGHVYIGGISGLLMQCRAGWDVTCSRCGKLDDRWIEWYANALKHVARPHLDEEHGVGR